MTSVKDLQYFNVVHNTNACMHGHYNIHACINTDKELNRIASTTVQSCRS